MDLAAVVLALGTPNRDGARRVRSTAAAALEAGFEPTVIVVTDVALAWSMPDGATVLLDDALERSESSALRVGIDWCAHAGAAGVVLALETHRTNSLPASSPADWVRLSQAGDAPLVLGTVGGVFVGLVHIDARAFGILPITGPAAALWERHPELVAEQPLDVVPAITRDVSSVLGAVDAPPLASKDDIAAVTRLLGRPPSGAFRVVVRNVVGEPVVIENEPFLGDGTPMPTRYWLVGKAEREAVGRLEAGGGIHAAEQEIAEQEIADSHRRYEMLRDALIPADHVGPRPYGGVGGTRRGVKCLHAHLAWHLAGGRDPVGQFVARQLAAVLEGPVAAIDCGTNSTRLLIVGRDGTTLHRQMIITRLGEGVDHSGVLTSDAIERTVSALRSYQEVIATSGVVRVRATATSAARDAANSAEFFDRAALVIGVRPELISGEEEGRLTYRGATADLTETGPVLVVDIGGGSTELVAGPLHGGVPSAVVSLPIGCVRITERFLSSDPPDVDQLVAARDYVAELLAAALAKLPKLSSPHSIVGVAGTVSTLAQLALGLDEYDRDAIHHAVLSAERVESLLGELSRESVASRRARPAIEHDREDVIVAGALVLAEVLNQLGRRELTCSEADILDGLAAELLERPITRSMPVRQ